MTQRAASVHERRPMTRYRAVHPGLREVYGVDFGTFFVNQVIFHSIPQVKKADKDNRAPNARGGAHAA